MPLPVALDRVAHSAGRASDHLEEIDRPQPHPSGEHHIDALGMEPARPALQAAFSMGDIRYLAICGLTALYIDQHVILRSAEVFLHQVVQAPALG